jgi:hypothetical protein
MTQVDDGLIFTGWFVVGAMFIFLPTLFLIRADWLSGLQFDKEFPEFAWLRVLYTLILVIWIPLSIIFTGRFLQSVETLPFFVFIVFIPLIGVGVTKAIIELVFGVSSHYGGRKLRDRRSVKPRIITTSMSGFAMFQYYYAYGGNRIRLVGLTRLAINVGLLAIMIYFLV